MSLLFVNLDDPYMLDVAAELRLSIPLAAAISTKPDTVHSTVGADLQVIDSRLLYRAADVSVALPSVSWRVPSRAQLYELLEAERHFLIMTDRTVHQPVSMRERKRLFRNLVCAWLGWFAHNPAIEAVFFESTPHMGFDVVVFHVAKMLGLRTMILNRTLLENYVFLSADYRYRPGIVGRADRADALPQLVPDEEWHALVGGRNAWIAASLAKNREARGPDVSRLRRWVTRGMAPFLIAKTAIQRLNGKPRFATPFAGNGQIHPLRQYFRHREMRTHVASLRQKYRNFVGEPDLSVPYIYFALHYQPERTSQPEALEYEDQFLAVATLAAAIPPSWRIYVKDHPRQFALNPPGAHRRHARTELDYEELASLPNVEMVNEYSDSQALIRNAQVCATLTGSTGWEALIARKPVFVFGPCWYCECDAVFLIDSVDSARVAIQEAEQVTATDVGNSLRRFLESLRSRVFLGTTGRVFSSGTSHSYAELVRGLSDGICAELSVHGE